MTGKKDVFRKPGVLVPVIPGIRKNFWIPGTSGLKFRDPETTGITELREKKGNGKSMRANKAVFWAKFSNFFFFLNLIFESGCHRYP